MAFTQTDLDNVEAAIVELATGARVVNLDIAGKSIRFAEVDLDKLRNLQGIIQQELGAAVNRAYAKNVRRF